MNRELIADEENPDQENNKTNTEDKIFEQQKQQLPTVGNSNGTSNEKTEIEKKMGMMNQSFGKNGASQILLQSPDKEDHH